MRFLKILTDVGGVRSPALYSTLTAAGLITMVACDQLTSLENPDVVEAEDFASAAGASTIAGGAITQFHGAVGNSHGMIRNSALITDELMATHSTAVGADAPVVWDRRDGSDPSLSAAPYEYLHDARQRLLTAIAHFQRVAPDSSARIGHLFGLLGYTSLFFGESFCAGVPLSSRDADLRPVYGEPRTTPELFEAALASFDSALSYGIDSARIADLARVGRGRALLNLGRFEEAAEAVAAVPSPYVFNLNYVEVDLLANGLAFVSASNNPENEVTIPEREGTNGLNWRTANDPRVVVVNRSPAVLGADGVTEVWLSALYETPSAPIELASGIEARLIEAEAALQAGNTANWLAVLNSLRATVPGLPPLTDPGDGGARVDLHFRERAFWLFLRGHRHGDLRRLVRQYGRAEEAVFPTGGWRDGLRYGDATSIAPPPAQLGNPNYTGCLNRDA